MSRVFDAFYFSAANHYGEPSQIEAAKAEDDRINAAWELHEAEQDLKAGLQENQPFEFIFFTESK